MSIPSTVVLPDDIPAELECPGCGELVSPDAEHFFPHRATGGLHLNTPHGCRAFEADYRAKLASDPARVIKRRPRRAADPEPKGYVAPPMAAPALAIPAAWVEAGVEASLAV